MSEQSGRDETVSYETVCPICFIRYPAGTVRVAMPTCSDCDGEAISVGVEPVADVLAQRSLEEWDKLLRDWDATEGFLPKYKAEKSARISALRDLKAQEQGPA